MYPVSDPLTLFLICLVSLNTREYEIGRSYGVGGTLYLTILIIVPLAS